ncbi:MAG: hypothetical protein SXA11_18615 [Cyanobacteriota bacterium]|nr:hypothetical protein [Cyanobacteriota bacterium]
MAYWIKIFYERSTYLIDLDSISAFTNEPNKKLTFWLPNSSQPIILHVRGYEEAYKEVIEYVTKRMTCAGGSDRWICISYDRREWYIDLNSISSFASESNGRITFWLADSMKDIVINPHQNPEAYKTLIAFIKKNTGYSLP